MRNRVFSNPSGAAELLEELFQPVGTAMPGEVSTMKRQKEQQGLPRHPHSKAVTFCAAQLCGVLPGIQPRPSRSTFGHGCTPGHGTALEYQGPTSSAKAGAENTGWVLIWARPDKSQIDCSSRGEQVISRDVMSVLSYFPFSLQSLSQNEFNEELFSAYRMVLHKLDGFL